VLRSLVDIFDNWNRCSHIRRTNTIERTQVDCRLVSRIFRQSNGTVKSQASTCSLISVPNGDRLSAINVSGIDGSTLTCRWYRSMPFLRTANIELKHDRSVHIVVTRRSSRHYRYTVQQVDTRVPCHNEHKDRQSIAVGRDYSRHRPTTPESDRRRQHSSMVMFVVTNVRLHCGLLIASQNKIAR
jgi:hypothetical protein